MTSTPERLTRKQRQEHTRSCLLEAAGRVFARRGLTQASVDEVAADAGFTKGAVYANFGSKEELFLAMLDVRFAHRLGRDGPCAEHRGVARGPGAGGRARVHRPPRGRSGMGSPVLRGGAARVARRGLPREAAAALRADARADGGSAAGTCGGRRLRSRRPVRPARDDDLRHGQRRRVRALCRAGCRARRAVLLHVGAVHARGGVAPGGWRRPAAKRPETCADCFVTGASGFLGGAVVAAAPAAGWEVTGTALTHPGGSRWTCATRRRSTRLLVRLLPTRSSTPSTASTARRRWRSMRSAPGMSPRRLLAAARAAGARVVGRDLRWRRRSPATGGRRRAAGHGLRGDEGRGRGRGAGREPRGADGADVAADRRAGPRPVAARGAGAGGGARRGARDVLHRRDPLCDPGRRSGGGAGGVGGPRWWWAAARGWRGWREPVGAGAVGGGGGGLGWRVAAGCPGTGRSAAPLSAGQRAGAGAAADALAGRSRDLRGLRPTGRRCARVRRAWTGAPVRQRSGASCVPLRDTSRPGTRACPAERPARPSATMPVWLQKTDPPPSRPTRCWAREPWRPESPPSPAATGITSPAWPPRSRSRRPTTGASWRSRS